MDPQQNQPLSNIPMGGGQPSVPPPPQPEVSVRTMQSDIKSTQEQGGSAPVPEKVAPVNFNGNAPAFQPTTDDVAVPPAGGNKKWLWIIILLVLISGGAGAAYYFYFPSASQPIEEAPVSQQTPPQSSQPVSQSLKASNAITLDALMQALRAEADKTLSSGELKEVALVDETGGVVYFSNLLIITLPEIEGGDFLKLIKDNFEEQFNAYLYYDENGVWPIYKAKLKSGAMADIVSLKSKLAGLEGQTVSSFYLDSTGIQSAFKDGQINGSATRYASFDKPGASFNYGLINDELIISTSYNGLKKLLE